MKCKKLVIETNGTSTGTKILVDGKQLESVRRIEFIGNVEDQFINILIESAKTDSNGHISTKKINIRDKISQKFIAGDKIITEPLLLEFER
jgi:hypothetical protein